MCDVTHRFVCHTWRQQRGFYSMNSLYSLPLSGRAPLSMRALPSMCFLPSALYFLCVRLSLCSLLCADSLICAGTGGGNNGTLRPTLYTRSTLYSLLSVRETLGSTPVLICVTLLIELCFTSGGNNGGLLYNLALLSTLSLLSTLYSLSALYSLPSIPCA